MPSLISRGALIFGLYATVGQSNHKVSAIFGSTIKDSILSGIIILSNPADYEDMNEWINNLCLDENARIDSTYKTNRFNEPQDIQIKSAYTNEANEQNKTI